MWIVIILIILFFMWALKDVVVGKPDSKLSKSRKNKLYYGCDYYGGFDDISVKINNVVDVVFNEHDIDFNFHKEWNILNTRNIKYSDIIKVKFMNETNITKEVSLGKMICFGWLSLVMKNEKKEIKEYVVIETKYENENISIVLEAFFHNNERLLKEIKDRVEKVKEIGSV